MTGSESFATFGQMLRDRRIARQREEVRDLEKALRRVIERLPGHIDQYPSNESVDFRYSDDPDLQKIVSTFRGYTGSWWELSEELTAIHEWFEKHDLHMHLGYSTIVIVPKPD